MAQLSDDCFAFNGPLLPVADAERLIAERVAPVEGLETVTLRQAVGRVLADNIVAPVNVPPFDNSAVDGYAVRAEDLATVPVELRIVAEVPAGAGFGGHVGPGEAARIFTGAPMPAGYGFPRAQVVGPHPAAHYAEQFQQLGLAGLDVAGKRAAVEKALQEAKVERVPPRPNSQHVAADLMAFFYGSSEGEDFLYGAAIKRDDCRGLENSGQRPVALN